MKGGRFRSLTTSRPSGKEYDEKIRTLENNINELQNQINVLEKEKENCCGRKEELEAQLSEMEKNKIPVGGVPTVLSVPGVKENAPQKQEGGKNRRNRKRSNRKRSNKKRSNKKRSNRK